MRYSCLRLARALVLALVVFLLSPLLSRAYAQDAGSLAQACDTLNLQSCASQPACGSCCGSCGTSCDGGGSGRLSCPAGYSPYDDYCLPDCPAGYIRDPGYPGLCLPPCHYGCPAGFEPVPLPACPDGFHRDLADPDRCLPDTGGGDCGEGLRYSAETGRCDPICPPGTYVDEHGLCRSNYERECPAGWQRNPETGACLPAGNWPPGYRFICLPLCPQGWLRDPFAPTRCLPPRTECPPGFERTDGRCLPVCPTGVARDPYGYCVPQCPPDSYQDLRGHCVPVGCPEGTENVRGQCLPVCPPDTRRNPDNPQQCGGVPTQPQCPPGTTFNDQTGGCDRHVPDCRKGLHLNPDTMQCEPDQPGTPRQPDCPRGMVHDKNGRCVMLPPPPPPTCPDGFHMLNGRCLPVLAPSHPAVPDCGPGTAFSPQTGRCEPILRRPPRLCPLGMRFDLRRQSCVPFAGFNAGPPHLMVPEPNVFRRLPAGRLPGGGCPPGTVRDGNGRCIAGPQ